ncbi:MAG: hypothetical protein PVH61_13120 [Candidatus Aminicenantes bacterium]|jgi:hypothetical protein
MEKRQDKRFKTRQIVKVCGKIGVVNDISNSGIQLSTAYAPKNRTLDISIDANGGEISFIGIIQWVKWKKQLQSLNEMGIIIKDAPLEYLDFVKKFNKS